MTTDKLRMVEAGVAAEYKRVSAMFIAARDRRDLLDQDAANAQDAADEREITFDEADRVSALAEKANEMVRRLESRREALWTAMSALEEARTLAETAKSDRKVNERRRAQMLEPRALPELLKRVPR